MICTNCRSERVLSVSGKCSDMGWACLQPRSDAKASDKVIENTGYVPADLNIGGGDYLEIDVCLECGHMRGNWPISDRHARQQIQRM